MEKKGEVSEFFLVSQSGFFFSRRKKNALSISLLPLSLSVSQFSPFAFVFASFSLFLLRPRWDARRRTTPVRSSLSSSWRASRERRAYRPREEALDEREKGRAKRSIVVDLFAVKRRF